jgi:N-acetylglutamate synthase-like GNAT family acetyltransferase
MSKRPETYVGECWHEFHIVERDGLVAGFVHWRENFVHALHVHSPCARSRAGSVLMGLAEAEIAGAGFSSVRLETDTFNTRSRAFYAACGFREIDQYRDQEWNSDLTTVLLEKVLC